MTAGGDGPDPAAMTTPPIRVGLVGFGLAGEVFHAPLIAVDPTLALASIVTANEDRAARARDRYPGALVIPNVEELWRRADEHDLVVVATPNRVHVPIALAAFEAGLHVVVDKPLAPSSGDGRRIADAAAERGLVFTVFQNRRLDGDFLTVRRLIDEGSLGPVWRFESRFERWRPERDAEGWRERGAPEEAGGVLFDLGSHLVDQVMQLFGPPRRVYAEIERRRAGAEVDDDAFVALAHADGVRSHLWMSQAAAGYGPRFRVLGVAGAFEKHGLDLQEAQLSQGLVPSDDEYGRDPPELWGRVIAGDEARAVETERGAYPRFYAAVAEAIRGASPPPVGPGEVIAALEVLEAARESAASGRVVDLG